jgi:hypothetical protein
LWQGPSKLLLLNPLPQHPEVVAQEPHTPLSPSQEAVLLTSWLLLLPQQSADYRQ